MGERARTLAGYEIVKRIASGGMADVYLARHPITSRRLALKVLKWDLEGKEKARERFDREVRVLGALEHENIVGILDAGVAEDTRPFMTMDYVEGSSLSELAGSAMT